MPGLPLAHDAIGMPHSFPAPGLSWVQGAVPGWGTQGMRQHNHPLALQDPVLHLFGVALDARKS